jgi:Bacterial PH domain
MSMPLQYNPFQYNPETRNPVARRMMNDEYRARPPDLAVFRYTGMNAGIAFFGFLYLILMVSLLWSTKAQYVSVHAFLPLVFAVPCVLGWLASIVTAVRVRADGLVIDNLVVRHVIPWERFAGLSVENGVGMFARLDDGRTIKSVAFSRSLSDALQRYQHQRETLEHIRARCQAARGVHAAVTPEPSCRRELNIPWQAALAFVALLEALSWIGYFAHGG